MNDPDFYIFCSFTLRVSTKPYMNVQVNYRNYVQYVHYIDTEVTLSPSLPLSSYLATIHRSQSSPPLSILSSWSSVLARTRVVQDYTFNLSW